MTISPASSASELLERVGANLERVRSRITSSGRDLASVRIVAVTKTFGVDEVQAAWQLGLRHFGENYVDELCEKRDAAPDATWHFLGALQTNKITRASACAGVLSAVTRERELEKLAALASVNLLDVQV